MLLMRIRLSRRAILESCIVRGALISAAGCSQVQLLHAWQQTESQSNLKPTAAEVLGPFYRKGSPEQRSLRAAGDAGFPLQVSGRVTDAQGKLIEGASVELWHADHHGHYDTKGYKYRAKIGVDAKGEYALSTVLPGHYADRPAQHIHYLITAPGHRTLITQAYFATDPFFEGDLSKHWNKRGIVHNRELILPVTLYEGQGGESARAGIRFDIVLEKA
jgi:protocatechuate 3,4-dioxygenase beta subunit